MSVRRITNIFIVVATLLVPTIVAVSFYLSSQPEELGKGIIINNSIKIPKNQPFDDMKSYTLSRSKVIWNGGKIIEIIEPSTDRMGK